MSNIKRPPKLITTDGVTKLNPAYLEWKKQTGGGAAGAATFKRQDPIESMTLRITIIQGSDLVAKDRNLFGKKTTSDPYVQILAGSGRSYVRLGQTKTIYKNLSPQWNETITAQVKYIHHARSELRFQIYDEDKLSDPDNMGVVTLPLIWETTNGTPQWYEIPKNSAKNAQGKIQLQIQSQIHHLQGLKSYV
ncbi:C2 domain containing protein [Nitzschia inconspicua]|uniref:C2 domain containing protein n=1 Tax=Nitzschia inconspicua TaxID=303405 RepID=A0A9K3LW75_9STRA|nr:C2 domain containing protein [Nitzschia inconspicua]